MNTDVDAQTLAPVSVGSGEEEKRTMHRYFVTILASLVLLLATTTPASAITGNFVDDNEHPFVGLVVLYDENGRFQDRCSGSLLTPTVFLTAGHCVDDPAVTARIYFQQEAGVNYDPATGRPDPVTGYPETCAPDTLGTFCATSDELYDYGLTGGALQGDRRDLGLIILDQPIALAEYGKLAAAGSLDQLATRRGRQEVTFTVSGYGFSLANPVKFASYRERLMATSELVNLKSALTGGFNLQTTNNPGTGGGTCFGDSGGPVFYGSSSSNLIVAVNSFGLNQNCRGTDFAYRTDTTAVIDWILDTVPNSEVSEIQIVPLT